MKVRRSRTISHLLFAMVAFATASGVVSPAPVQAQTIEVCKEIDDMADRAALFCVLCDQSFWFRLVNWSLCSACSLPYAPN